MKNSFHIFLFFKDNVYGITTDDDKSITIDSNLRDMVVFNGVDRIRQGGLINSVTINFSSPPRIPNPSITLYVLACENDSSNMFCIIDEQPLPSTHIYQGRGGVQKIVLDNPVECLEKQFVALAFGAHSGTPACIKNRNEHSVKLDRFHKAKSNGESIHFNKYPNQGAAFSFVVDQRLESMIYFKSLFLL